MSMSFWDPFDAVGRLEAQFDDMVRRTVGAESPPRAANVGFLPAVEIYHDGEDLVIAVELPGVDPDKDVTVEVHDGRLLISGSREQRSERATEDGRVLVREIRSGSFRREFGLPEGTGPDDVDAEFDAGVLYLTIRGVNKPEPQPKQISVKKVIRSGEAAQEPQTVEAAGEEPAES